MKLIKHGLLLAGLTIAIQANAANEWLRMEGTTVATRSNRNIVPEKYVLYAANEASLEAMLENAGNTAATAVIINLPMPDGTLQAFRVWTNTTMAAELAKHYTEIKTFTAVAVKNEQISAKLDITPRGFHAMIFNGRLTSFIDPYSKTAEGYYISYYRKDYCKAANTGMTCSVDGTISEKGIEETPLNALRTVNGSQLRTYRLALACTGEYATAVGGATPTKASVLSAMVTTMNRVNGVYERELAVTMQMIANNDTLIFLDGTTDPYSNNNGGTMLSQNQTAVTSRIGGANYDIGHVFSTGGGGIAILGSVCRSSSKAQGVTGSSVPTGDAFDIDYVAHEMGHQFGSDHTFNNDVSGSCDGNAAQSLAYEPGGGTTIMAYAGICSPNDVQSNSDDYFHAKSLVDIVATITANAVASCPVITTSGAKAAAIPAFTSAYNIPYKTPFEITAPQAVDSVSGATTTYCWEQWNLGDFGALIANTHLAGPIFRSFDPDTSRTRVFPIINRIVANVNTYLGERVPDTARRLTFRLTTRSIVNGIGGVHFADDSITMNVVNTGAPFLVTSPNTTGISWVGNTTKTITWNVVNTDIAPISAATVDIYLSTDGGFTYPTTIATNVPNTGTADVIIPNTPTTAARIKIKGTGNVFFDISNFNFTITLGNNASVAGVNSIKGVTVYPNPATDVIQIANAKTDMLTISLVDVTGKTIYHTTAVGNFNLPVAAFARGIYYLKLNNSKTGESQVQKIVLQ